MRIRRVILCRHDSKLWMSTLAAVVIFIAALANPRAVLPEEEKEKPMPPVLAEYAGKHMLQGGWTHP